VKECAAEPGLDILPDIQYRTSLLFGKLSSGRCEIGEGRGAMKKMGFFTLFKTKIFINYINYYLYKIYTISIIM